MILTEAVCPAAAEQQEAETSEQPDQQEAPETRAASTKQPPQSSKVTLVFLMVSFYSPGQVVGQTEQESRR